MDVFSECSGRKHVISFLTQLLFLHSRIKKNFLINNGLQWLRNVHKFTHFIKMVSVLFLTFFPANEWIGEDVKVRNWCCGRHYQTRVSVHCSKFPSSHAFTWILRQSINVFSILCVTRVPGITTKILLDEMNSVFF